MRRLSDWTTNFSFLFFFLHSWLGRCIQIVATNKKEHIILSQESICIGGRRRMAVRISNEIYRLIGSESFCFVYSLFLSVVVVVFKA